MKKLLIALTASALFAFSASAQELDMVDIPGKDFKMLRTEVTQELYEEVMGENPSYFQVGSKFYENGHKKAYAVTEGENVKKLPVESVSWYDAIYFCNKLSIKKGLTPVYAIDCETDVAKWNFTPHKGEDLKGKVTRVFSASGFRLPTKEEWRYAAAGGEEGFNENHFDDEICWYNENSDWMTHEVAKKKPNGYGLYDMIGNVCEWGWESYRYRGDICGLEHGNCYSSDEYNTSADNDYVVSSRPRELGFRIVCKTASALFAFTASAQELDMIQIPGKNFKMLKTEVTQKLYEIVMGENPSEYNESNNPVEMVSWYDAIYFCNKLSMKKRLSPVYAVDGETDVAKWNYTPHKGKKLEGEVTQNTSASGFRLPTVEEWQYAARGGENYEYSGSNNRDEVSWCDENSNKKTHEVAKKKPNGYGLYDMSGNVWEWCWDDYDGSDRYLCGGNFYSGYECKVDYRFQSDAYGRYPTVGFRIVCAAE